MGLEILPFSNSHLPEAARLLATTYSHDRRSLPVLSPRLENPGSAERLLQAILAIPDMAGFAAFESGTMTAYILGYALTGDPVWGPAGFVPLFGSACAPNAEPSVVKILYAEIGRLWVQRGILSHYVFLPASDTRMSHLWFSLSFGIEQVHAIADIKHRTAAKPAFPAGVRIREVRPDDADELAQLSDVIWRVQVEAPVWAPTTSQNASEIREGWRTLPKDDNAFVFGAFRDKELVGLQLYAPAERTDRNVYLPDGCITLVVAGTTAAERGLGINTALTEHGFSYALLHGYTNCETDWRSTNTLSSSFWPRRGFSPYVYRLVRRIDQRIVDAKDQTKPSSVPDQVTSP